MFGLNVQGNLGKKKIRPYSAGRYGTNGFSYIIDYHLSQLSSGHVVHLEIRGYIHKGLIYGIGEDILGCEILKKHPVDFSSTIDVHLHSRRGNDILNVRRNILNAAPILDTQSLHGR